MGELLLYNGSIHTVDADRPQAEAVHICNDRISFVGGEAEARGRSSPSARLVDLRGRTLIPGFNDNHLHLIAMGEDLSRPNLKGLNASQIVELLKEAYPGAEAGETIYAAGWDYPSCPHPHRDILDAEFPDNPVVLIQFSGHAIWVNSRVLRQHQIGPSTPDPEGGEILRDEQGLPTGILRESAAFPVQRALYQKLYTSRALQRGYLDRALEALREVGISSIQDNTWFPATVSLLRQHNRRGLLTVRVSCWFYGMMPAFAALMRLQRFDDLWVRRGPWKYLLDGTFSTYTAWLLQPYAGRQSAGKFVGNAGDLAGSGNYGIATGVRDKIHRYVARSVRRGRQGAFHAIGDRTIRELIDEVQALSVHHRGVEDLRIRIEHAQLIAAEDIPRLAALGILVSAQPSALGTPEKDVELLGEERALRAYPYRSLLDAGVELSFGSDMPGESSFDPLLGIHYTVNRPGPERISAAEALRAYTLGSAYAEFQESQKGSITAGKLADLAILSEDPLSVQSERIREIEVQMTIVGGSIVYQKEGAWPFIDAGN